MSPSHIQDGLKPDERVAVLSWDPHVDFYVHPAADTTEAVQASAAREGSEALATHLQHHAEIAVVDPSGRAWPPTRRRWPG